MSENIFISLTNPLTSTGAPVQLAIGVTILVGQNQADVRASARLIIEQLVHAKRQVVVIDDHLGSVGLRVRSDRRAHGFAIPVFGGAYQDLPLPDDMEVLADVLEHQRVSAVLCLQGEPSSFGRRVGQLLHRFRFNKTPLTVVILPGWILGDDSCRGLWDEHRAGSPHEQSVVAVNPPQEWLRRHSSSIEAMMMHRMAALDPYQQEIKHWYSLQATSATNQLPSLASLATGQAIVISGPSVVPLITLIAQPETALEAAGEVVCREIVDITGLLEELQNQQALKEHRDRYAVLEQARSGVLVSTIARSVGWPHAKVIATLTEHHLTPCLRSVEKLVLDPSETELILRTFTEYQSIKAIVAATGIPRPMVAAILSTVPRAQISAWKRLALKRYQIDYCANKKAPAGKKSTGAQ